MPAEQPAAIPAEFEKAVLKLGIRHPHIGKNINQMWGTSKFMDYLQDLLYDKRPGRMGFQRYILITLMQLHVAHEKLFPAQKMNVSAQAESIKQREMENSFSWDEFKG